MNKDRRLRLLDAASQLDEVVSAIRDIQDEEQEAFDNMPEGFQCGDRGTAMMDAVDKMEDFICLIEKLQSEIEDFAK